MIANFTFDEMVYNSIAKGRIIYYDGEQKVIDYIKMDKNTRQLIINCTDGSVFSALQDDVFQFEVNNKYEWKKPNKKRLKGLVST